MTFNTIDEISIPDEDDSVISLEEKEESKSRDNDNEKFVATEPNPIDEVKALAKSETRKMTFWKVFVVVSLLVTGAAVSSSVYFFLERKQEGDFKNQVCVLCTVYSYPSAQCLSSSYLGRFNTCNSFPT